MPAAPTIVFLDAGTVDDLPAFEKFQDLGDFTAYARTVPDELIEHATGAEVLITNKVRLTAEAIARLPDLKLICVAATGTNNIDKKAAEQRGIPVRNVAGYSTDSVAQLTLTAFFAVAMDLLHLNREVYNGNYSRAQDFTLWRHPFYELSGKRYGIIGMGTIGRRVAELATAHGAEVVYFSAPGSRSRCTLFTTGARGVPRIVRRSQHPLRPHGSDPGPTRPRTAAADEAHRLSGQRSPAAASSSRQISSPPSTKGPLPGRPSMYLPQSPFRTVTPTCPSIIRKSSYSLPTSAGPALRPVPA